MKWFRSELAKGVGLLGIFLVLIVTVNLLTPYSVSQPGYTLVDIGTLADNPLPLEGHRISSSAGIIDTDAQGSYSIAHTAEGVLLVFSQSAGVPEKGDHVLFRGISWVSSNNSIVVEEVYIHQSYSSIIRSIPGIVLFVALFFAVFTVDWKRVAFVVRR